MKWLLVSIVLTVLLNVAIRLWPGAAQRGTERLTDWAAQGSSEDGREPGRTRIFFPWKAMLLASVVLTVLLNVVLRIV